MAENNKQLEEAKKLLQEINTLRGRLNQTPLKMTDGEAVQNIQSLRNELKGVQKSFEDVDSSATSLYDQVRAISSELSNQKTPLQMIRGSMKKITSIAEDLKMQEQGIKDLSTKQLDDLAEKIKLNKKILDDESEKLLKGRGLSEEAQKEIKTLQEFIKEQGGVNKLKDQSLDTTLELVNMMGSLTAEQKAVLSNYVDQGSAINSIEGHIQKVKEEQMEVNKLMGVGGALVDGLDGLMGKLGMNSSRFKDAIAESKEKMKATAEEMVATKSGASKLTVLMSGLGPLASGFAAALFDPLTIILKIVDAFFKVDKAATDFQRKTGMSAESIAGANSELATSVDFLQTAGELTDQIGMNAVVALGPDLVAGAAGLKNELGLSAENAGMLALNAKLSGNSMAGLEAQVQSATEEFNNTTDSAANSLQVLRDMGKASKSIQAQFASNPGALAKAAAAARKVGMELKDMEGVMDNLLNFEDSIAAEMEAELLTGKELNLNKARELALSNDIEGVSNELFKNAQDVQNFSKMNRFEQESYAKALGMSRDQLAEMAIQKSLLSDMSDEEKAKLRGVTIQESKRMDLQEKMQIAMDKLIQAFTPLLDIIGDIVGIIAPVLQVFGGLVGYAVKFLNTLGIIKPLIIGIVAVMAAGKIASFFGTATAGAMKFAQSIKGMKFSLEGMKSSFSGMMDSVKSWGSGIKDAFKGGMSGASKLTDTVKDKAGEVTQDAQGRFRDAKGRFAKAPGTDKAADMAETAKDGVSDKVAGGTDKVVESSNAASKAEDPKSSGEKLKEFFTNLAAGLKEMASTKVVGGALALIPASIGLIAFAPGYLGAKLIERIDGPKLQEGLTGLSTGLSALGSGKVMLGALALAIAAPAFVIAIAGIPGMIAIGSLGSTTSTGLTALASGLQSMTSTYAGIGALALTAGAFVLMLAAIPGMLFVALTGSMVAAGLTGLATGLTAFGTAAANPLLWLGIAALGAFGIAMIPLSYAISLLAPAIEAFGTVITSVFNGIATLVGAVAAGFVTLMDSVTLEKVMNMALLGPALLGAAVGLTAFSAALAAGSIAGGVASFLTGGGLLADLQTLVDMATPLQTVAGSLTAIAAALGGIGLALATMETEKLEEMQDLIQTTAFAAPAIAAAGAIGDMISGITGGGKEESGKAESNDKLIAKIDELIVAVKQGKNINMDGRRVGGTLQLAASNT